MPQYAQKREAERKKNAISMEEFVAKQLPKIGVVIAVLGVGFLTASQWSSFSPLLRVLILYVGSAAVLVGGIFLERKERYQNLGRALVGGGWALTFLVTYVIRHAAAVRVLPSDGADLVLLIAVGAVMVWHTLKYDSQAVTGIAFLLAFTAVTLNPDPPYNLIAGAILVCGMTVIVRRYQWFELEVFGILASYLNHFYWLYQVFQQQGHRAPFPQLGTSMALMVGYWAIFRTSYLWRKVSNPQRESVSTVAALLNPLLFLAVMKYQSFHPEWAFYAILGMGAVEFTLGQLPAARRRVAPFQILSSLGATLMVAAVPFKYSGNALELLWLAGAEVFLLAGIIMRERLFRAFGLIVSALVAVYGLPLKLAPLGESIVSGKPHYDAQLALLLGVVAVVLYLNSHVIKRIWAECFTGELESQALAALSFLASVYAVGAIYAIAADKVVASALALFVLVLCWAGQKFSFRELIYQGHWVAVVAFTQVIYSGRNLETQWHGVPDRIWMFSTVAALLYASSRYVRLAGGAGEKLMAPLYAWAGSALIALLILFHAPAWSVIVLWVGFGLVLATASEVFKRPDFKWQAFVLVLLSTGRALLVNFDLTTKWHGLTLRLISVSLSAAGIYLLARWAPFKQIRPVYTVLGTFLLTVLAFQEAPEPWTAVAWISLALVLCLAARWWKDRALLWQTHVLSLLAAVWTLYANFAPQYREKPVQLITVGITAALLYLLNWLTNITDVVADERICQGYSWAGSLLLSWLAWYQLQPINVSLAWGILGLLLFEAPDLLRLGKGLAQRNLRIQAYVALTGSFVHLFYANFNAPAAGGFLQAVKDPSVLTTLPLVLIYFWVYSRLRPAEAGPPAAGKIAWLGENGMACLGTATVAALVRFQTSAEWVAVGYAVIVVAVLAVAWLATLEIFLYQAMAMLGVAAFRISFYNFYHLQERFTASLSSSVWALALLAAGVPLAFMVRRQAQQSPARQGWFHVLARHPEQPMFFVPMLLTAVLLALKLPSGIMGLGWSAEGILVFVLALVAKERSFRLAGLGLLAATFLKLLMWDMWHFESANARIFTLIGVGVIFVVVGFLYAKNREALREYL